MSDEFVPHADWPFPKPEQLENKILRDEIERLTKALHFEQHWLSHIGTHGPECWRWGPNHYECALRKIKDAEKKECNYPDCVDNGPDGKCTRWLLGECEKSEDYRGERD